MQKKSDKARPHQYLRTAVSTLIILASTAIISLHFLSSSTSDNYSISAETELSSELASSSEPDQAVATVTRLNGDEIQAALNLTVANLAGEYSVIVHDLETDETLGMIAEENIYFTASLYKLYLAFIIWQDVDNGLLAPNDSLVDHPDYGAKSVTECLDLMVRTSDSPCAEAFLSRYDYDDLQVRLLRLGLTDIDMPNFMTSAGDMLQLLRLIHHQQHLSNGASSQLLEAMRNQVYGQGLRQAFLKTGKNQVYNKVGFSYRDWHDIGLLELQTTSQSKWLAVVILSRRAGENNVRKLADSLEATLIDQLVDTRH